MTSRIKKRRRKGVKIPYWIVNDPLARGIKLFLMVLEIRLELLDLIFYCTQLVDIKAHFSLRKGQRPPQSEVSKSNPCGFCSITVASEFIWPWRIRMV